MLFIYLFIFFFLLISIYGYMTIKVFVLFLPRTCKRMIGVLLGIEKKEVCSEDVEMQRKERN